MLGKSKKVVAALLAVAMLSIGMTSTIINAQTPDYTDFTIAMEDCVVENGVATVPVTIYNAPGTVEGMTLMISSDGSLSNCSATGDTYSFMAVDMSDTSWAMTALSFSGTTFNITFDVPETTTNDINISIDSAELVVDGEAQYPAMVGATIHMATPEETTTTAPEVTTTTEDVTTTAPEVTTTTEDVTTTTPEVTTTTEDVTTTPDVTTTTEDVTTTTPVVTTTTAEVTTTTPVVTTTTAEVTTTTPVVTTTTPVVTTTTPVVTTTTTPVVTTTTTPDVTTTTATTPSTLLGDVNVDGKVNIVDLVMMSKYIIGIYTPTAQGVINSDMDVNGKTNVVDLVRLSKQLIGIK